MKITRHYPRLATLACASLSLIARAQPAGEINAHDPSSIIKLGGTYYYFATGQGIISRTSTNEITWTAGTSVFATQPAWTTSAVPGFTGFFWAPDVIFRNNQYYMYYAVSTFGSKVSAIGLATSPTLNPSAPNYAWTDQGPLIQSGNASNFNAIDPSILQDATTGRMWMSYGSFNAGIFVTELDSLTGKPLAASPRVNVADHNVEIEASSLIQHGGFYYLFVNWGGCCAGIDSTYEIRVGRSTSPTGPFLDRNGAPMLTGGGTLFYDDDGARTGPGQFALYSEAGQDQFSYHYYDGKRNGAPAFGLSNLYWSPDNWPSVAPINPDWSGTASALWSSASNWVNDSVPTGNGSVANFVANAANRYTVTLDTPQTVSRINFRSPSSFTIGINGGNTLTFSKMALDAAATINVSDGSHTIAAPISTVNDLGINVTPPTSTLSITGSLSAASLYKFGHGILALSGTNTYSGQISTRAGSITISGALFTTGNLTAGNVAGDVGALIISGNAFVSVGADLNIGDTGDAGTPATGTLYIQNNASVTVSSAFVVGSGFFANTAASGTVYQSGGTLTANGNFDGAFIIGGRTSTLPTGTYNLSAGTIIANTNVRVGGFGTGIFNQSGGLFSTSNFVSIGRFAGATGTWNISAGQLNLTNAAHWLLVGESGAGTLNISGSALISTAGIIHVGHTAGAGTLNLNGGSLTTLGIQRGTGSATIYFNGGTLLPNANSATFLQGLSAAYVQFGGAALNTNAKNITLAQNLLHDPTLGAALDGGLSKFGPGILTLTGNNSYTGPTTVSAGTLLFNPAQSTTSSLSLQNTAIVQLTGSGNAFKAPIFLAGTTDAWTAQLDLTTDSLIVQTTPANKSATLDTLNNQITSGANGTAWTGPGITSSTIPATDPNHYGIALFDNAILNKPSFGGQPADTNSIFITIAHLGDANLNGIVDIQDLTIVANNWQQPRNNWAAGDLNRDGIVTIQDLTIVANNWQQTSQFPLSPGHLVTSSSVPEPTSLLLSLPALALLLLRRRANRPA